MDVTGEWTLIDIAGLPQGRPLDNGWPAPRIGNVAIGPDGGFIAYAAETALEHDPELSSLTRGAETRWFTVDPNARHAPRAHAIH